MNFSTMWCFDMNRLEPVQPPFKLRNSKNHHRIFKQVKCDQPEFMKITIFEELELGPSINGLVTDGFTKVYCRGFDLALFQSATVNKIVP